MWEVQSITVKSNQVCLDIGLMTINALACADSVLIPVQAAKLALEGLQELLRDSPYSEENQSKAQNRRNSSDNGQSKDQIRQGDNRDAP